MRLTWCAMQKMQLSALFVVIPVFIAQTVSRFCKFQDLFSDTEADSVICDIVIFIGYFCKISKLQ